jgi:GT2 family glycosyltransferase
MPQALCDPSLDGRLDGPDEHTVTFVVPVRNDAVRLKRCLESITADARGFSHEIIVMDHQSSDDSLDVARRCGARVATRGTANVAALRNEGVALARAPVIAFIDADHQVSPGWLGAALGSLREPGVGAVGAPYHAPPDGTWVQRTYDGLRRHPDRKEPAEWFGAGNLAVRREAFRAAGGFDTRLESCEDVDLCFRIRAAGWQLMSVPEMHSVHHGDPPTLGRLFLSELWRGRDNLRVSWRGPRSLRNMLSMAIPLVQLAALAAVILGVTVGSPTGTTIALLSLAIILSLVMLRALSLVRNARPANPGGFPAALAVAATFDAGRALALVARAGHHRRTVADAVTTT